MIPKENILKETKECPFKLMNPKIVSEKNLEYTPNIITHLEKNEVFVFGSNSSGFHGAGFAGFACRGVRDFNWRKDAWFLKAMRSPVGSFARKGKWAVYGISRGFQEGRYGCSYAIETIKKPGMKRSVSLEDIQNQIITFSKFAHSKKNIKFLVILIGSKLAGYSCEEIGDIFRMITFSNNVLLPKEYTH